MNSIEQEQYDEWMRTKPRYTERECLEIFPDAIRTSIPNAIKTHEEAEAELTAEYRKRLKGVLKATKDPFSIEVCREVLHRNLLEKILKHKAHILRLKSLLKPLEKTNPANWVSPEMVEKARQKPIESLLGGMQKRWRVWAGLCPFHEEKTPSFQVGEDNRFKCWGCGAAGDSIDFWMKWKGISFLEAVRELYDR